MDLIKEEAAILEVVAAAAVVEATALPTLRRLLIRHSSEFLFCGAVVREGVDGDKLAGVL